MSEYLVINLIVALPALLLALWRNKKLCERNLNAMGFKWGYFTGFRILFVAIILLPLLVLAALSGHLTEDELLGFYFLVIVVLLAPGIFILCRHRWAWILYTVCSMNPVLWMINGTYIKNRWKELSEESSATPISTGSKPETPRPAPTAPASPPPMPIAPLTHPEPPPTAQPQPPATPTPQRKRGIHGSLIAALIALVLFAVVLPIGFYVAGKAFIDYAKESLERSPLCVAVAVGNIQEVDRLLAEGADPDEKALMGHSALIMATDSDRSLIAERLLKAGANPNQKDNLSWAPLHHAVKTDAANLDMISILVRHGAHVDVTDKHLRTPLHRAAQFGHVQAVQLLLRLGADANAKDENGWTPLDRGRAHPAIVRILEANN